MGHIAVEPLLPGEPWIVKPGSSVYLACCDCELVHRIYFRLEGKKVIMHWYRDDKATKLLRRRKKE